MIKLTLNAHIKIDLQTLAKIDVNATAKCIALLEELKCNPDLVDNMNRQQCSFSLPDGPSRHVMHFAALQPKSIWRLKFWDDRDQVVPFRILYAYYPAGQHRRTPEIEILAVVNRGTYNYVISDPITQRVLRAYEWGR